MMSQIEQGWGGDPSPRYNDLANRFRPLFKQIREGAVDRERARKLPLDEIKALKALGFGAVRVPASAGGAGASLPELVALLIELSQADSNLTQGLRGHFGFSEDVIYSTDAARKALWFPRLVRGDIVGNAWSEIGEARTTAFSTKVTRGGEGLRLNGEKYYTTGSYYADWIDVGSSDEDGKGFGATVARDAAGVLVVDDWDGFGQTLTVSGTATFRDVAVDPAHVVRDESRPKYFPAFFQLVHLATLAGIGRAASNDVARLVAERRRTYTHANGPRASQDPQVLQVVGRVRGAAYAAGAVVLRSAEAVQRVADAHQLGNAEAEDHAVAIAELEVSQALTVVSTLVLDSLTLLFDALGASAVSRQHSLDRYWRNARTLASHNPRIYKDRIVGDFAVNGTLPPPQWRIGLPEPQVKA